jgi:glycosyltransferase involved in cell wall biosynthesis
MQLQVLVSTMNLKDPIELAKKMNIQSDAIIINQSDTFNYSKAKLGPNFIETYTLNEKGIGLSRNTALMRAESSVCLIADDDVVYVDRYADKVVNAFKENPNADVILFNLTSLNPDRPEFIIKNKETVRWYRSLRYGAFRVAYRNSSIKKANISFSRQFGGGTKYSSGEDSIFIYDCIKNKLKVIALPVSLGTVKQDKSTWFKGYTEQYFIDKGALFKKIFPRFIIFIIIQFAIRKYNTHKSKMNILRSIKLMLSGARKFSKNEDEK